MSTPRPLAGRSIVGGPEMMTAWFAQDTVKCRPHCRCQENRTAGDGCAHDHRVPEPLALTERGEFRYALKTPNRDGPTLITAIEDPAVIERIRTTTP